MVPFLSGLKKETSTCSCLGRELVIFVCGGVGSDCIRVIEVVGVVGGVGEDAHFVHDGLDHVPERRLK